MRPRYTGPLVVVSRNRGGAYILAELDGTLAHAPFAAFRVLSYFAREHIDIPDLEQHLDVTAARLREMEATNTTDPESLDAPDTTEEQHDSADTLED